MTGKIRLKVISPDQQVFDGPVDSLVIPGADGLFGVLHNHAPMISLLAPGVIKYRSAPGGATVAIAIAGGFAEIKDNLVSVVADAAELGEKVDLARARAAQERARQHLANRSREETNIDRAEHALKRAISRLQARGER